MSPDTLRKLYVCARKGKSFFSSLVRKRGGERDAMIIITIATTFSSASVCSAARSQLLTNYLLIFNILQSLCIQWPIFFESIKIANAINVSKFQKLCDVSMEYRTKILLLHFHVHLSSIIEYPCRHMHKEISYFHVILWFPVGYFESKSHNEGNACIRCTFASFFLFFHF